MPTGVGIELILIGIFFMILIVGNMIVDRLDKIYAEIRKFWWVCDHMKDDLK